MSMLRGVFARKRPLPPTAVMSYGGWGSDSLGLVIAETGAAVESVSFGMNGGELANRMLGGLIVPMRELGERAVGMLAKRMGEPGVNVKSEVVPFGKL